MMDFESAREHMVLNQLLPNGVTDPKVLDALLATPREEFVPPPLRNVAYVDEDIRIAPGRWLMEPLTLARLIEMADIRSDDVALIVGCGTGYSAAVAAKLASAVVALEEDGDLVSAASENLSQQAIDNAAVVEGALTEGYKGQAPYDVILIDGAVERVPEAILNQLAEGGRLVTVLDETEPGKGVLYERIEGIVGRRPLFDAAVQLLPGFEKPKAFAF